MDSENWSPLTGTSNGKVHDHYQQPPELYNFRLHLYNTSAMARTKQTACSQVCAEDHTSGKFFCVEFVTRS
jgi:hypothetical protein